MKTEREVRLINNSSDAVQKGATMNELLNAKPCPFCGEKSITIREGSTFTEAAAPVDADVRPRNPLHNQHVYVYWRWKGFVAERCGCRMKAFFMRDWARQEAEAQSAA